MTDRPGATAPPCSSTGTRWPTPTANQDSSLHKAYEQLLEHYNVHFVVPAPTCHPDQLASQQAWIERVFSAPAWNRVIFANDLQLLYGDYLISSSETPDFIGTSLRFGSDELKTWEDIIVFFDRLGGQ